MATVIPLQRDRCGVELASRRADVRLALTARGRRLVVAVAFVAGLLVAAVALLVLDLPSAFAGADSSATTTVTVQPGQTLWQFAEDNAPDGVSAQEYIAEVRTLNHLPTGRVTSGQSLELPGAGYVYR